MFQFRAFPSHGYLIHHVILEYCSSVLPHSEISGSKLICSSPKLIAACHVLHRLLMPRHSPCALISLTYKLRMIFLAKFSWIMQAQQKLFTKLYLPFDYKVSTMLFYKCDLTIAPLCCLAFHHHFSLFSFQGAVKDTSCTLKIEQCKNGRFLFPRRSDLGMLHRTCGPVRSP